MDSVNTVINIICSIFSHSERDTAYAHVNVAIYSKSIGIEEI